jgi:hypothetical protein
VLETGINSDQIILISILKQQKKLRFLFRFRKQTYWRCGCANLHTKPLTAQGLLKEKTTIFLAFKGIGSNYKDQLRVPQTTVDSLVF